jgi:hypothetical protein
MNARFHALQTLHAASTISQPSEQLKTEESDSSVLFHVPSSSLLFIIFMIN